SFSTPHSPLPTPPPLGVGGVEFLQFVHVQLLCANDFFQPEDQRRVVFGRFPGFCVSRRRPPPHLKILPEPPRVVFPSANFGRFDRRRSAERDDLVAQVLRLKVRLAARRCEERGELLALLPRHKTLLLKVLDRRGVFQR